MDSLFSDSRCKLNNRIVISNNMNNKKTIKKLIVNNIKFSVAIRPNKNTKTIDKTNLKKVDRITIITV